MDFLTEAWTFESLYGTNTEWFRSAGRWDNELQAAEAAVRWLMLCAKNKFSVAVRLVPVIEIEIMQ